MKLEVTKGAEDYWHSLVLGYQSEDPLEKRLKVENPKVVTMDWDLSDGEYQSWINRDLSWGNGWGSTAAYEPQGKISYGMEQGILVIGEECLWTYRGFEQAGYAGPKIEGSIEGENKRVVQMERDPEEVWQWIQSKRKEWGHKEEALRWGYGKREIKKHEWLEKQGMWMKTPKAMLEWMRKERVATAWIEMNQQGRWRLGKTRHQERVRVTIHPPLKKWGVSRWLESYEVFQRVNRWVDQAMEKTEAGSVMSNEEKIKSHGFDLKSSFRPKHKGNQG